MRLTCLSNSDRNSGRAFLLTVLCYVCCIAPFALFAQAPNVNGFTIWQTGHDGQTTQLVPEPGASALIQYQGQTVAHVKFSVSEYGELWFPLANTPPNQESVGVDLSGSSAVTITYRANHDVVLQLRQTGVHGGVQNHVILPATSQTITTTIPFARFSGGLRPLDLRDVAKFNFAVLANDTHDGYAELYIYYVMVDGYFPGR